MAETYEDKMKAMMALSISREKERGTIEQRAVSPVGRFDI